MTHQPKIGRGFLTFDAHPRKIQLKEHLAS